MEMFLIPLIAFLINIYPKLKVKKNYNRKIPVNELPMKQSSIVNNKN